MISKQNIEMGIGRFGLISKNDRRFFLKAKRVAQISDFYKTHVGCIAVYKNTIIGMGCNAEKTHPLQLYYNQYRLNDSELLPKIHAEISCISSIRHLDINFQKVKLYIYRTRCDQEFGMARPCPSCLAAIKDLGIENVYYTTNDGYAYEFIKNNRDYSKRERLYYANTLSVL